MLWMVLVGDDSGSRKVGRVVLAVVRSDCVDSMVAILVAIVSVSNDNQIDACGVILFRHQSLKICERRRLCIKIRKE